MASEVSICNQALSWLGGEPISRLDSDTTEAILCNANYALLRDTVIEEGKWTFATARFKLVPNPTGPAYGYAYRFELPSQILIVTHVTNNNSNKNDSNDYDYRIEGGFILCDDSVVWIKAIVQITDPSKFTATFVQALAARIANDIAMPLTESKAKEERMQKKYDAHIATALAIDGMQGKSDRVKTNSRIIKRR